MTTAKIVTVRIPVRKNETSLTVMTKETKVESSE